jgi:hypothetical protein
LRLNRSSVRADVLNQRCKGTGIEFRDLTQADFLTFMKTERQNVGKSRQWWPDTLVFLGFRASAFEIFARSVSTTYFNRVKHLLGIENLADLTPLLESYRKGERGLPQWNYESIDPKMLLGYDKLATRP